MKFLIFFALVALSSAQELKYESMKFKVPDNVDEFISRADDFYALNRDSRIANGWNVDSNLLWPFVVELTIALGPSIFTCTGSIINTNFVLSGRECIFCSVCNLHADSLMVRAGSHLQTGNRFTTWVIHGDYVTAPSPPQPSFAVMRLETHIPAWASISTIRLPTAVQAVSFFEMQRASIAGWGTFGSSASPILQQATGMITSRPECTPAFVPGLSIYDLCLRGDIPDMAIQSGDMGGPLIISEPDGLTLIGVLNDVGDTTTPGIHFNLAFRIGHFWNFIHDRANVTRRP